MLTVSFLIAKNFLEELTGKTIRGMRQFPEKRLSSEKLKAMQFIYRSPMDFSNIFFFKNALERKIAYEEHEIMVIPESVSPYSRLPGRVLSACRGTEKDWRPQRC
jgi:hypothetical protein